MKANRFVAICSLHRFVAKLIIVLITLIMMSDSEDAGPSRKRQKTTINDASTSTREQELYVRFYSYRFIAGFYCRLKRIKELEELCELQREQLKEKADEICELSAVVVANKLVGDAPVHIDDFRVGTIALSVILDFYTCFQSMQRRKRRPSTRSSILCQT